MKHGTQQFELGIFISQSVPMRQEKLLPINLTGQRLTMNSYPALFFQIITTPDVMITDKEMHLHSQIGQLGNLPQETSIAFRHYQFELVPKVEYISQQVHCCSIMFYTIQKKLGARVNIEIDPQTQAVVDTVERVLAARENAMNQPGTEA